MLQGGSGVQTKKLPMFRWGVMRSHHPPPNLKHPGTLSFSHIILGMNYFSLHSLTRSQNDLNERMCCVVLCCVVLFRDIEQCRIIINIHFSCSQIFENDLNDLKGFKMEIPYPFSDSDAANLGRKPSIYIFLTTLCRSDSDVIPQTII